MPAHCSRASWAARSLLIFTGSFAHDKAEAVAAQLEHAGEVAFAGAFKTLLVYRKVG